MTVAMNQKSPPGSRAAELIQAILEWMDALTAVEAAEPEGWLDPAYARELVRERRLFHRLRDMQGKARNRCLP